MNSRALRSFLFSDIPFDHRVSQKLLFTWIRHPRYQVVHEDRPTREIVISIEHFQCLINADHQVVKTYDLASFKRILNERAG